MSIADNLQRVREKIKRAALSAGRNFQEVKLVAVTKGVESERIIEAARCGAGVFGENYAQEFKDKHGIVNEALGSKAEWHFIGRIQRNKVKYLMGKVDLIESLDSVSVAEEINARAGRLEIQVPVLIEVNSGGEEVKGGVEPERVENFLIEMKRFRHISVNGLMAIPPFFDNPEMSRPYFRALKELKDKLESKFPGLSELSMGMSGDFETAVEEGATIVRIGTAIFGHRM